MAEVVWRIRPRASQLLVLPFPGARPRRPGAARAQARGGDVSPWQYFGSGRCSVPEWWFPPGLLLPLAPHPGSPLSHLRALFIPYPGQAERGPSPVTPLCTVPEQSPRGCEPRRSCPWAGTGGGLAGSRKGERAAGPVRRLQPGPRVSLRSCRRKPPAPPSAAARPARCSPHRPPPQPWRKFIDVSMPGLKEKPPRNPPHTDMRRSWGWRRPKR